MGNENVFTGTMDSLGERAARSIKQCGSSHFRASNAPMWVCHVKWRLFYNLSLYLLSVIKESLTLHKSCDRTADIYVVNISSSLLPFGYSSIIASQCPIILSIRRQVGRSRQAAGYSLLIRAQLFPLASTALELS